MTSVYASAEQLISELFIDPQIWSLTLSAEQGVNQVVCNLTLTLLVFTRPHSTPSIQVIPTLIVKMLPSTNPPSS